MLSLQMMRLRSPRPWILAGVVLLLSSVAFADDLDKNASLLREADDFRVRTQAALALGASRDKRAVVPLCQGVSDQHRVVRIASATALSRLALGGSGCIDNRLRSESDATVKAALQKALAKLGGGELPEPAIGSATRIYVAIDKLSGPARFNDPVRAAFVRGIGSNTEVAVAPRKETPSQAEKVLGRYPDAVGFKLTVTAPRPVYEGGQLKISLSVAILTYPGNSIVGTFTQRLAMPGVTTPDAKAEEELLLAAAESAMKKFLQIAPSLAP